MSPKGRATERQQDHEQEPDHDHDHVHVHVHERQRSGGDTSPLELARKHCDWVAAWSTHAGALRGLPPPPVEAPSDEAMGAFASHAEALAADPGLLGDVHEALLLSESRKETGRFYTPKRWVAAALLDTTSSLDDASRVLDPACGTGRFLLGAGRGQLYGVELDKDAAAIARVSTWLAGRPTRVEVGDPLLGLVDRRGGTSHETAVDPVAVFGGPFDLVCGNPPYRAGRFARLDDRYRRAFEAAEYQLDPYVLFIELGLACLKEGGVLLFVVPGAWMSNLRTGRLRKLLLETGLVSVRALPPDAFGAGVETVIVQARKGRERERAEVPYYDPGGRQVGGLVVDRASPTEPMPLCSDDGALRVLRASRQWTGSLGEVCEITRGINPYHHSTHTPLEIERRTHHADHRRDPTYVPELCGGDLQSYRLRWGGRRFISYGPWLKEPRDPRFFRGPRLLVRKILGATICAAYHVEPLCCDQSVYIARPNADQPWPHGALLAFINSELMTRWIRMRHRNASLFPQLKVAELRALPLPPVVPDGDDVRALGADALLLQAQDGGDEALRASIEARILSMYGL